MNSVLKELEISKIRQICSLSTSDTVNLAIGELNFKNTLSKLLKKNFFETTYTSNYGDYELRTLISAFHKKPFSNNVLVTNGAEEALYISILGLTNQGDEIFLPETCYPAYEAISKLAKLKIKFYKLSKDFSIDLEHLKSQLNAKTKIIIINNPANPTGKTYYKQYEDLCSITNKFNTYLLVDEVYSSFIYKENYVPILNYTDNYLIINSVSKMHVATGLRVGWILTKNNLIDEFVKLKQYISTCAPSISQQLAKYILNGTLLDEQNKILNKVKKNRDFIFKNLKKNSFFDISKPEGAFYYFLKIKNKEDSFELCKNILKTVKLLLVPGSAFNKNDYIRLSFGIDEKILVDGLLKLNSYITLRGE